MYNLPILHLSKPNVIFQFNFVGKLLGPKGNSLKRLQEETLTKMAVLGKGSMRDKAKEEEMRLGKDPKYHHLNGELHVEIVAFAPPAEAHARMSYALTEVRKYLIPDSNDTIRQLQMKELEILNSSEKMLTDPGMQLLKTVPVGGMPSMPSMPNMQPLLVPSTGSYLPSPHLSLLPTPPLDSAPGGGTPTIQAPPTKYDTELEAGEGGVSGQGAGAGHMSRHLSLKMSETKRGERRRETAQPY